MNQFGNVRYNALAICTGLIMVLPVWAYSAGLVPCGGPSEEPCQTCHVVQLISNIVNWLIVILGLLAALVVIYAGILLVTSGGNTSAKEKAKSIFSNFLIGYTIVLAAWLLIDYGIKTLVDESKFGPWNAISCVAQPIVSAEQIIYIDLGLSNFVGGGLLVRNQDGSITPPGGSTTNLGGSCSVITDSNNPCSASRLSNLCFGARASQASQICSIESGGGNQRLISGTDRCRDGRSFSGGLWQINILSEGRALGCDTSGFVTEGGGAQGSCARYVTNSQGFTYCAVRNCYFRDENAYNTCMARTFDLQAADAYACRLYNTRGFQPWQGSAGRCNIPH